MNEIVRVKDLPELICGAVGIIVMGRVILNMWIKHRHFKEQVLTPEEQNRVSDLLSKYNQYQITGEEWVELNKLREKSNKTISLE